MGCGAPSKPLSDIAHVPAPRASPEIAKAASQAPSLKDSRVEQAWDLSRDGVGLALQAVILGLKAAPFGEPVAAVLTLIYDCACQASINKANCMRLVTLVQACGEALQGEGVLARVQQEEPERMQQLMSALEEALELVRSFGPRCFLLRIVRASSDKADFERVHANLSTWMLAMAFLNIRVPRPGYEEGGSEALASALCSLGGSIDPQQALLNLREQGRLGELRQLQQLQGMEEQVLSGMLDEVARALTEAIARLDSRMGGIDTRVSRLESLLAERDRERREEVEGVLPKYLQCWWNEWLDELADVAPRNDFLQALIKWFKHKDKEALLSKYDARLMQDGFLDSIGVQPQDEPAHASSLFMKLVLWRLVDEDRNDLVTKGELYRLQIRANEWARRKSKEDPPDDVTSLCNVVFKCFDREELRREFSLRSEAGGQLQAIVQALKVSEVVTSYGLSKLTSQYHEGTRQWMYDRVNQWLDSMDPDLGGSWPGSAAAPQQTGAGVGGSGDVQAVRGGTGSGEGLPPSRLFLLLADAGMGKSVFSAVMSTKLEARLNGQGGALLMVQHFFKVGERRGQARTMLLCLALQLAEQLRGFAAMLGPVVARHGDGQALPGIQDVFEKFLLEPLTQLEAARRSPGSELPATRVLLLLDALDESDDSGRGWEPVTQLVANDFMRLPPWVSVLLTSRPQVEERFRAWSPQRIDPSDQRNLEDMRVLAALQLRQGGYVEEQHVEGATDLLLARSEGQFIYTKFAFQALRAAQVRATAPSTNAATSCTSSSPRWAVSELEGHLPPGTGVHSTYLHSLQSLHSALGEEAPALLALLQGRLLPVLSASHDLLTLEEAAWATEVPLEQVHTLVRLIGNLFPLRGGRITSYHKSVLDWLAGDTHSHPYRVDMAVGHASLARACCTLLTGLPLALEDTAPQQGVAAAGAGREGEAGWAYALRHAVKHACHRRGSADLLKGLLLDLGAWHAIFKAGLGPSVLSDLSRLQQDAPPQAAGVVQDIIRWLHLFPDTQTCTDPCQLLASALMCPVRTAVFTAAERVACCRPAPHTQLPTVAATHWSAWPPLESVLRGHSGTVHGLAVSPDGAQVASASADRSLRLWCARTGQCAAILSGHTAWVNSVAFSPDGQNLVSASRDQTVRLWSVAAAQCTATLEGHTGTVYRAVFSPDGRLVASASTDKSVRVWEVASGQCVAVLTGHTDTVYCVAFSPDGQTLASGGCDKSVRVWDTQSHQCTAMLTGHTGTVYSVAFSPSGQSMASAGDKTVCLWDLATGRSLSTLSGHRDSVTCVAFSPSGSILASTSTDHSVRLWSVSSSHCVAQLSGHSDGVYAVAFTPDGTKVVSAGADATLVVWDAGAAAEQSSASQQGHTGTVYSVAVSADGRQAASGSRDSTVCVWDLHSNPGAPLCTAKLAGHASMVSCVAYGPDGCTLASASTDSTLRLWDTRAGGCTATLTGHTDWVNAVALSPDGKLVASGSRNGEVFLWDAKTSSRTAALSGHVQSVSCVAFSPAGKQVVGSGADGTLRLWDIKSHKCVATLSSPPGAGAVNGVALSPDGATLASACADGTVRLWDLLRGECTAVLSGHRAQVMSVAFAPGGERLCSASADKSVRVWDVASGQCVATACGHSSAVNAVAFTPDGSRLLSAGADKTLRVWKVSTAP